MDWEGEVVSVPFFPGKTLGRRRALSPIAPSVWRTAGLARSHPEKPQRAPACRALLLDCWVVPASPGVLPLLLLWGFSLCPRHWAGSACLGESVLCEESAVCSSSCLCTVSFHQNSGECAAVFLPPSPPQSCRTPLAPLLDAGHRVPSCGVSVSVCGCPTAASCLCFSAGSDVLLSPPSVVCIQFQIFYSSSLEGVFL